MEGFIVYGANDGVPSANYYAKSTGIEGMPSVRFDTNNQPIINDQPHTPDGPGFGPLLVPAETTGDRLDSLQVPSTTFAEAAGNQDVQYVTSSRPFASTEQLAAMGITIDRDAILDYTRNQELAGRVISLLQDPQA